MKNILYILVVIFLASCAKPKVDLVFDKLPEQRMAERNAELSTKLIENTSGWKAFLRTSLKGGGYGFYMKFNPDETVAMYSDWNNATASTVKSSTYSIKYIMNTSLVFDTYNYITIMQDPQSSVNGGSQPDGLRSDIEFEYVRAAGDSVILRGKKYLNYLYLVKANATEASAYNDGQYLSAINSFKNYFQTHFNNYISVSSGGATVKMGVTFDNSSKTVNVQGKVGANITSDVQGFGFSIDGVSFINSINFAGVSFSSIKMKDANNLVFIDNQGNEYPIIQSPTPLTDFKDVFGGTTSKAYNSIYLVGGIKPAGVTSSFNSVYDGLVTRFKNASNRLVDTVEFRLMNSNTAYVKIWYWSGTTHFLADASFTYTLDAEGLLTLTNYTPAASNTNWTSRINEIGNFVNWIQSGPFQVDWVGSSVLGAPNYGGLYRKQDSTDFFYGYLRKQ